MPPDTPETASALLHCPACRSPLRVGRPVESLEERCPVCRASVHLTLFPRLFRDYEVERIDSPAASEEASCSFFPELRAQRVCDECGCFLSHRAAVEWGGVDLCLPCLHRLRETEARPDYLGRAKLDDRRALALVTWLAPFTLFTAPIALFLLFRGRKASPGFVPRGNAIWWIAFLLSVAWLGAWLVLMVAWASLVRDGFR
jgi:hypothetical protein